MVIRKRKKIHFEELFSNITYHSYRLSNIFINFISGIRDYILYLSKIISTKNNYTIIVTFNYPYKIKQNNYYKRDILF